MLHSGQNVFSSQILSTKDDENITGYNFPCCSKGYGFHIDLDFESKMLRKILGLKKRKRNSNCAIITEKSRKITYADF
jgi:hypothetical protein